MTTKAVCKHAEKTTLTRQRRLFTLIWRRWTARAHGQAYVRALLLTALRRAQARVDNPQWRLRLRRWQERVRGQ
jgi:hypothetical protein